MLAIAEAEHLNVVQPHGAAGRWDVARRAVKDSVVIPRECALLNHEFVDDVNAVDFDVRVRKGFEPAAVERDAGRLSLTAYPARTRANRRHERESLWDDAWHT